MINTDMRTYNYFIYEDQDEYAQQKLSEEVQGSIRMAINITSQSVQDNINYKDCSYIGLTLNSAIDDTYVIQYGDVRLKVLYVNPRGRYKQVFMSEV